jgi:hypothetical protein
MAGVNKALIEQLNKLYGVDEKRIKYYTELPMGKFPTEPINPESYYGGRGQGAEYDLIYARETNEHKTKMSKYDKDKKQYDKDVRAWFAKEAELYENPFSEFNSDLHAKMQEEIKARQAYQNKLSENAARHMQAQNQTQAQAQAGPPMSVSHQAYQAGYHAGYKLGYDAGHHAGYAQAVAYRQAPPVYGTVRVRKSRKSRRSKSRKSNSI